MWSCCLRYDGCLVCVTWHNILFSTIVLQWVEPGCNNHNAGMLYMNDEPKSILALSAYCFKWFYNQNQWFGSFLWLWSSFISASSLFCGKKVSWFTNTTTKSIHIFKQNMLAQHVVSPCTQQPDQFTPPDNLRRNQLRDGGRHYSLAHYPVIWEVCWSSGSRADAADRHCYMRAGNKTRLLRRCFLSPAEIKILIGNRSAYYSQR